MSRWYIGCKQIEAWPQEQDGNVGYGVRYPDGYESWSPKETFEAAYLPMGDDPTKITAQMVDDFIDSYTDTKIAASTTVVAGNLLNGFTVTATSACVDPGNYDHEVGVKLCKSRIESKV